MSDILERLQAVTEDPDFPRMGSEKWFPVCLAREAVTEIRRLRALNDDMMEKLREDTRELAESYNAGWERGFATADDSLRAAIERLRNSVFCLSAEKRALIDEVERLRAERDELLVTLK